MFAQYLLIKTSSNCNVVTGRAVTFTLQLGFKGHNALQLNNRPMSAEEFSHKNQATALTL